MTDEERRLHIAEAGLNPEVRKFLSDMLAQMVGEDEEKWQMVLEEAGSAVGQDGPEWTEAAESALESITELLYRPGNSPQELLSIVNEGL